MNAQDLVKMFEKEYEQSFDDILPMNRRHATACMRRAFEWCGEDETRVSAIIAFVIQNWNRVRSELGLRGRPSISLFGSANLFHQIRALHDDGFGRVSVKERFVEDSSPSIGW